MTKKIILGFLFGLLLSLALAGGFVWFRGGEILRGTLVKTITQALGTPAQIEKLQLNPIGGNITIPKIVVSNPSGLTTPYFMGINDLDIKIKPLSLIQPTVVIEQFKIGSWDINIEQSLSKGNISEIIGYLQKNSPNKEVSNNKSAPKKVTPNKVSIGTIKTLVKLSFLNQSIQRDFKFDNIDLINVNSSNAEPILLDQYVIRLVSQTLKTVLTESKQEIEKNLPQLPNLPFLKNAPLQSLQELIDRLPMP